MNRIKPPSFTAETFADRAFEWLEEAIIKGDLAPETKLDEAGLAKAFGISRGPVREAIRRLEGKKLVERVPHVGARVVAFSKENLADILHVREALEGMACRLATERMSDAELGALEELLEGHAKQGPLKAGEYYFQRPGDYDFHYRIIIGSGSEKLNDSRARRPASLGNSKHPSSIKLFSLPPKVERSNSILELGDQRVWETRCEGEVGGPVGASSSASPLPSSTPQPP